MMNGDEVHRKRSAMLLALAILTFAGSFLMFGDSEMGLRFFMWRDQPQVAVALLVVSGVSWWFWWRGAGSKPA